MFCLAKNAYVNKLIQRRPQGDLVVPDSALTTREENISVENYKEVVLTLVVGPCFCANTVASCRLRQASIQYYVWKSPHRKSWKSSVPIPRRKQQLKLLHTVIYITLMKIFLILKYM